MRHTRCIVGAVLAAVLCRGAPARAQSPYPLHLGVTWDLPTTNEDGTPLTDLAGTVLCVTFGPLPATALSDTHLQDCALLIQLLDPAAPPATWEGWVTVPGPAAGTLYLYAVAIDTAKARNMSAYSVAAQIDYPAQDRLAPGTVTTTTVTTTTTARVP